MRPKQKWGAPFIAFWCASIGLHPLEAGAMWQLRPGVTEAADISAPCQRWCRGQIAATDEVLAGRHFDAYAQDFASREEAIVALANAAFARLLASAGKAKCAEYVRGLFVTGELLKSPHDEVEN
jgi:hypothetical protein